MKINLDGLTYEAKRITAAMTRRALELNALALDAAAKAEMLKEDPDTGLAKALIVLLRDNINEKADLIVDAFGGQFDRELLLNQATAAEINAILNQIAKG